MGRRKPPYDPAILHAQVDAELLSKVKERTNELGITLTHWCNRIMSYALAANLFDISIKEIQLMAEETAQARENFYKLYNLDGTRKTDDLTPEKIVRVKKQEAAFFRQKDGARIIATVGKKKIKTKK